MEVIKTFAQVIYKSCDITKEISEDLLSLTYNDGITDEADSLDLTLQDSECKWVKYWQPERGDTLEVILTNSKTGVLTTDLMQVDKISFSGLPRIFNISAVSVPLNNTIRRTVKNRNFENVDLKSIINTIAQDNNLKPFLDFEDNPKYDRVNQNQESDLEFLKRLCDDAALTVKVASEQLIVFDQLSYEKKEPICFLILGADNILSFSFESQQSERYRSCTVRWRNPRKKTVDKPTESKVQTLANSRAVSNNQDTQNNEVEIDLSFDKDKWAKKGNQSKKAEYFIYTYVDETVSESGQEYAVKKRCTSIVEAERIAKATLRKLNLQQMTGNINLVGNTTLYAGAVVELLGFGYFDGRFLIEKATHSYASSGYTTSIDVRKINSEY